MEVKVCGQREDCLAEVGGRQGLCVILFTSCPWKGILGVDHILGMDLSVSSLSTMPTPGSNLAKQAAAACTPHPT